jgi:hypothetical protein
VIHKYLDIAPIIGTFSKRVKGISELLTYLILFMNALLLFSYTESSDNKPEDPKLGSLGDTSTLIILNLVGAIILILSLLILCIKLPVESLDAWIEGSKIYEETKLEHKSQFGRKLYLCLLSIRLTFTSVLFTKEVFALLSCITFSILALSSNLFWFGGCFLGTLIQFTETMDLPPHKVYI